MDKQSYTILGAVAGFVYVLFSGQNIIVAVLIILIGALLGRGKWYAEEKKDREFEKLISTDKHDSQ